MPEEALLEGLCRHTATQALALPVLLLVQDTTSANFTRLRGVEELGPIDAGGLARGLFLHSTLAVSEQGRVLGLLGLQRWVRSPPGHPKPADKESSKWLCGIEQARQALGTASPDGIRPRLIHVMDREGDYFDVMLAVDDAGDSAIIRCAQDRRIDGPLGRAAKRCGPSRCWGFTGSRCRGGRAGRPGVRRWRCTACRWCCFPTGRNTRMAGR